MAYVFVHGVPDTPAMWDPLLAALELDPADVHRPALPGFTAPAAADFGATKDDYAAWLVGQLERVAQESGGPVDLVGHDWGSLLAVRAASLRPDLIRTWVASDAVPDPVYRGHRLAKLWWTPVVGELVMAVTTRAAMERSLRQAGFPAEVAAEEAAAWSPHMRRSILRLYRSARNFALDWEPELQDLPPRGLVLWGDKDPFVETAVAERFSARWTVPLHVEPDAGHWVMVQNPPWFAKHLTAHWTE